MAKAAEPVLSGELRLPNKQHPVLDLPHWLKLFPITDFEKKEGPRRFDSSKPDDPVDLWKARGCWIDSPADVCEIEHVRRRVQKKSSLGPAVPVDIFVWRLGKPDKPYLTKLGGHPFRPADRAWPLTEDEKPFTFLGQFCFLDSLDVIPRKLPGDVMLIFISDAKGIYDPDDGIRIEWVSSAIPNPVAAEQCPRPTFPVIQAAGVLHRWNEYPDSSEVFENEGHDQWYLFPSSQATKIGTSAFILQNDPRRRGEELLCVLSSISGARPSTKWPFTNREIIEEKKRESRQDAEVPYGFGEHELMFADVGCLYFLINKRGKVRVELDSY